MILKRLTLAWFRRMLPDDGRKGPKHVGAIKEKILNIIVAFYILIKGAFFGRIILYLSKCTVKPQLKGKSCLAKSCAVYFGVTV